MGCNRNLDVAQLRLFKNTLFILPFAFFLHMCSLGHLQIYLRQVNVRSITRVAIRQTMQILSPRGCLFVSTSHLTELFLLFQIMRKRLPRPCKEFLTPRKQKQSASILFDCSREYGFCTFHTNYLLLCSTPFGFQLGLGSAQRATPTGVGPVISCVVIGLYFALSLAILSI